MIYNKLSHSKIPKSHKDAEEFRQKYIQDSLDKLMQNRTTIVIAHRLSTFSRVDRILVFDKGKIVEEGTHTTLMGKDGLYPRMWNRQIGDDFYCDEFSCCHCFSVLRSVWLIPYTQWVLEMEVKVNTLKRENLKRMINL
jgi:energy-coupling factor transporter ATP-binding protein EcfA2